MSEQNTKPEPSLFSLLARDTAIALAVLSIWAAADTWYLVSGLGFALAISVLDAIFVGYILGALFHEWGHYTGAKLSGASAPQVKPEAHRCFGSTSYGDQYSAPVPLDELRWLGIPLGFASDFSPSNTLRQHWQNRSSKFGFRLHFVCLHRNRHLRKTLSGSDPAETLGSFQRKPFNKPAS